MEGVTGIWVALAVYTVLTLWIGYAAYLRAQPSAEDYYLQGRNVSTVHLALTQFATIASEIGRAHV